MDERQASAWISDARLGPFLAASDGDRHLAVALYEWHTRLGSSCFATVQHFEVLLRNAIDAELGRGQPQNPIPETWLMDFRVLQPNGVKQVIIAAERLEKGKEITRGRVVAGVSFGFWAGLFAKEYEELWRQRLRSVFPYGAVMRKDLTQPMRLIQRFRNRLAHHDCLLSQDPGRRVADMHRIAGLIDPAAADWIADQCQVEAVMSNRPREVE
jgi:hypothetical protein